MLPQGATGWFGKLPAQGDFLRGGMADPLVQRFAGWLEEASEACHRAGARPAAAVRFAWRPAGEARLLVGTLRDSVDKVGRPFPLSIFAAAGGAGLAAGFPGLPAAWDGFLGAAEALLAEAAALDAAGFAARVQALPLPGAREAAAAAPSGDGDPAAPVLARLFGDPATGGHLYAFHTFRFACGKHRGREPVRAEVVLDCPVEGPADVRLWLEAAGRTLAWPAPPPFLWREGPGPRLCLSLGTPPGAALLALCDPPRDHPKIWPLRTTRAAAVESARKALGPAAAALDRAGATVGELIATLSR